MQQSQRRKGWVVRAADSVPVGVVVCTQHRSLLSALSSQQPRLTRPRREIRASVVLRLNNLQLVNTFNDGELRFRRNWLRRNDRNMAMLAWALDRERRSRGLGDLTALNQLGNAKKRKNRAEFDVHECYNGTVDGLTHHINNSMPVYASFACEKENVGRSTQAVKHKNNARVRIMMS